MEVVPGHDHGVFAYPGTLTRVRKMKSNHIHVDHPHPNESHRSPVDRSDRRRIPSSDEYSSGICLERPFLPANNEFSGGDNELETVSFDSTDCATLGMNATSMAEGGKNIPQAIEIRWYPSLLRFLSASVSDMVDARGRVAEIGLADCFSILAVESFRFFKDDLNEVEAGSDIWGRNASSWNDEEAIGTTPLVTFEMGGERSPWNSWIAIVKVAQGCVVYVSPAAGWSRHDVIRWSPVVADSKECGGPAFCPS